VRGGITTITITKVAARQGFFWWEIDITYYLLRGLAATGLIWDLERSPKHIKNSKNKQHAALLRKEYESKQLKKK
jgi:stearoyl-CoA desaturase (delta-9 desaturase)